MNSFILGFIWALAIAAVMTKAVSILAVKFGIVDTPNSERKIHKKAVPLLGGLGIYLAFFVVVTYFASSTNELISGYLNMTQVAGILTGGAILMIGGFLDDKYNLPAKIQIIFPIVAVIVTMLFGIGIESLTNPIAGGTFYFGKILGSIFTFFWLMGMMYTTKYLDGLDGLTSGIGLIGAVIIFFVAQHVTLQQDYIALLAIIFAGALAGFLLFNFNPASIFLGEGGSVFVGYVIGVLSVLAGSKIATALLIFGIPIADVIWVIGRRLFSGQKIYIGDAMHLHHRLLKIGLNQRSAVLLLYFLTASFGVTALFFQTKYKLYVLALLGVFMVIFGLTLVYLYQRKQKYEKNNS